MQLRKYTSGLEHHFVFKYILKIVLSGNFPQLFIRPFLLTKLRQCNKNLMFYTFNCIYRCHSKWLLKEHMNKKKRTLNSSKARNDNDFSYFLYFFSFNFFGNNLFHCHLCRGLLLKRHCYYIYNFCNNSQGIVPTEFANNLNFVIVYFYLTQINPPFTRLYQDKTNKCWQL